MRRSASEILNDLENRVARLERSAVPLQHMTRPSSNPSEGEQLIDLLGGVRYLSRKISIKNPYGVEPVNGVFTIEFGKGIRRPDAPNMFTVEMNSSGNYDMIFYRKMKGQKTLISTQKNVSANNLKKVMLKEIDPPKTKNWTGRW
tara:strand:+ start:256 stop:690 length:435 start_codon:yes stop_codon:yes gene_type:complete